MPFQYQTVADIVISPWFFYWLMIFSLIAVFIYARRKIKKTIDDSSYFNHVVFLVRLPKEKPGDKEKEFTVQNLREEIAKGENIFASIGGLRAQRSLKSYLLGRNDHFSFEIVANKKKIVFYVVAPLDMARFVEQSINGQYPDAVVEEVSDYNIFTPQSTIVAGTLKTKRNFVFPLKTFQKMEIDPMNSIINVMSKLDENEGLAIQYIVRSAHKRWHRKIYLIKRKLRQTQSLTQALYVVRLNPVDYYLREFFSILSYKSKSKQAETQGYNQFRVTGMEEEMMKGIEEKNSKAGLDVNLRVIVSTEDKGKANLYLNNLANAFGQYNYYEYGNSFSNQISTWNQKK